MIIPEKYIQIRQRYYRRCLLMNYDPINPYYNKLIAEIKALEDENEKLKAENEKLKAEAEEQ